MTTECKWHSAEPLDQPAPPSKLFDRVSITLLNNYLDWSGLVKRGTRIPYPWSRTMRILVTGGAGYIGSHTVDLLLARGHQVHIFDNLTTGHRRAVPADRLIEGDLGDTPRLDH